MRPIDAHELSCIVAFKERPTIATQKHADMSFVSVSGLGHFPLTVVS